MIPISLLCLKATPGLAEAGGLSGWTCRLTGVEPGPLRMLWSRILPTVPAIGAGRYGRYRFSPQKLKIIISWEGLFLRASLEVQMVLQKNSFNFALKKSKIQSLDQLRSSVSFKCDWYWILLWHHSDQSEIVFGCRGIVKIQSPNCLRSTRIDSKEPIPEAYVAWRAGTITVASRTLESIPGPLKHLQIRAPEVSATHIAMKYGLMCLNVVFASGKGENSRWCDRMRGDVQGCRLFPQCAGTIRSYD
jgi:hypothetical protein